MVTNWPRVPIPGAHYFRVKRVFPQKRLKMENSEHRGPSLASWRHATLDERKINRSQQLTLEIFHLVLFNSNFCFTPFFLKSRLTFKNLFHFQLHEYGNAMSCEKGYANIHLGIMMKLMIFIDEWVVLGRQKLKKKIDRHTDVERSTNASAIDQIRRTARSEEKREKERNRKNWGWSGCHVGRRMEAEMFH